MDDDYRPKLRADIPDPAIAKGKGQAFIYLRVPPSPTLVHEEGYWVAKEVDGRVRIVNESGVCEIMPKLIQDGNAAIMAVFVKRWIEDYPDAPEWQVKAAKEILEELDRDV